jgi:steroid 5-alpha reductase family enzyme
MAIDDVAELAPETMLLVALAVTVVMQLSFFAVAFTCQIDKVTDLAGTLNFLALAVLSLVVQGLYATRAVVVTALVAVWAVRLGAHLLLRVLHRGKDARFDEMRANCVSFLGFWIFQIVWVFVVSLPVVLVNSSDAFQQDDDASGHAFGQSQDVVGIAVWAIGFVVEWAADASKEAFYHDKANRGKLLCAGVWKYSRHPNYFGEILCWIGVTIIASVTFTGSQQWFYVSVLSPVLTAVLLLFLSGIPMAEERYDERFGLQPLYLDYKSSTSPLVCLPPSLYRRLPMAVKRTLLFEFPMYSRKLCEIQRQQKEEGATTVYRSIP